MPGPFYEDTTVVEDIIPTVIAVGCSLAFVEQCRRVALRFGAIVEPQPLPGLTTVAASRKPLVLIVPSSMYEFDPEEFNLLARDVRASLMLVHDEGMDFRILELRLSEAIEQALQRRVDD